MAHSFVKIFVPTLVTGTQIPTLPIGAGISDEAVNICHATDDVLPLPAAVAPVTSAVAENGHVLKAGPGSVILLTANVGMTSGWLMLLDALTVPTIAGALPAVPVDMQWVGSNGTSGYGRLEYPAAPLKFLTGIVALFSVDPNPANFGIPPAGSKAWFMGQVK